MDTICSTMFLFGTLGRPPPTHRQFTFWSAAGWIHYPLDLLGEISMHQLVPTPPLWAGWDGNKRKDWRWHLSQNGTSDHPPPICKTCHAENSCVIFFYDTRQATTHPQAIHFLECCWLDPLSFGSPWWDLNASACAHSTSLRSVQAEALSACRCRGLWFKHEVPTVVRPAA